MRLKESETATASRSVKTEEEYKQRMLVNIPVRNEKCISVRYRTAFER